MAPLARASDTVEVIGVLGGTVTLPILNIDGNIDGNAIGWFIGNEPIVTVDLKDPFQPVFHKQEFQEHFAVSERGHVLSISQVRMEDAGIYSVTIGDKTFTFDLQVYRELAEPTVTCEAQNCSDGRCSFSLRCSTPGAGLGNVSHRWGMRDQLLAEGPMLLVNESLSDKLERLTCTARNPVSTMNVTITTPMVLCSANTTDPPSPGAHSGSWIKIFSIIAGSGTGLLLLVVLFCFIWYCKSKVLCMKKRRRGSAGSQHNSHGAAVDHMINSEKQAEESDGEPGEDQPFGAVQHYKSSFCC
ncbi:SLAM family member 9-like isoform X2 [Passer montanus]|uniref:SLAM family member 9-like isoform X2 n=1 Tax=Passer montanus TaxID=9160 RepID=UPI001960F3FC|nr:SLAM family member 9-like isoform X2 [Passer montanus]